MGTGYIIGPISGKPEGNRPLFECAKADLGRQGWECIIPQEIPEAVEAMREALSLGLGAVGRPAYQNVMRALLRISLSVDRHFLLPGWEQSSGARDEVRVGQTVGTPAYLWLGEGLGTRLIRPQLRVVVDAYDTLDVPVLGAHG